MVPLEQPSLSPEGDLKSRVERLERYLFRLTAQLQVALDRLEQQRKGE